MDEKLYDDDMPEDVKDALTTEEQTSDEVTHESVESAIERRLARERAIQERRYKRMFGTKSLEEAAQYVEAGRTVANAAGVSPQAVVDRVRQQYQPRVGQPGVGQQPDDVRQQLSEIRELIAIEREEKSRELQTSEVKKEFGTLYEQHQDEIALTAEERGLSLVDAAAITLRPYLKTHYEQQVQAKRQVAAQRKVEGSGEPPAGAGAVDYDSALTPSQKFVAKKMGLTNERYYKQLKELGKAPQQ